MGGRIGLAKSLAGSLLNIKPLIGVENGVVVPLGQARSRDKAYQMMVDLVEAAVGVGGKIKVAYVHAGALPEVLKIKQAVEETITGRGIHHCRALTSPGGAYRTGYSRIMLLPGHRSIALSPTASSALRASEQLLNLVVGSGRGFLYLLDDRKALDNSSGQPALGVGLPRSSTTAITYNHQIRSSNASRLYQRIS